MYRHISIFTLKDNNKMNHLISLLNEVGDNCKLIVRSQVGTNITKVLQEGQGPDFGDIIQMIDFETQEDLKAYPASKEHLELLHNGPEMIKVTAIDFEIKK